MYPDDDNSHPHGKNVMIIAGEASGDLHGSNLVKAMRRMDPALHFYGIGGEKLKEAGVKIVASSADMAVVGLTEVFARLGFILRVRRTLKRYLRDGACDLVILIDYPDFNLPLAKVAHNNNVKVFYYISPQVWAWRKRRIYDLARYVDRMAVILPFEKELYNKVNLDVSFVGHPLLDVVVRKHSDDEALQRFGLNDGMTTIGILPGSRHNEVVSLLPDMLEAALILTKRRASLQFVLPLADTLDYNFVADIVSRYPVDVRIIRDNVYDVIAVSDIAMVASGTATLETALLGTPMIVVYKVSPLSYYLGRLLIKVDNIALVNIIAGRTVIPELIQDAVTPEAMAREIHTLLNDEPRMDAIRQELGTIKDKLGSPGAAVKAARAAYGLL
jgi:lipid-A-disaccharide synthase